MLFLNSAFAGENKAKQELEIAPFRMNINTGLYQSRLSNWNALRETRYAQPSFFAQVYMPFKRSIDYESNFTEGEHSSNYYDRLFSSKMFVSLHITDKLGSATGLGNEFTLRIYKRFFANIQLAVVFVESPASTNDGLKSGFNFQNYWFMSCYLNHNVSLSAGFVHISNGRIWNPEDTALFDMLTIGASFNLNKPKAKNKE